VIQIDYDPSIISYKDIMDLFWLAHDPTTLNRQGNDEGTQYRSTIMYLNEEQKKIAEASLAEAQKEIPEKIVTEIVPLKKFYAAEDYHQDYFANNPYQGYGRVVVSPTVAKFKKKLEEKAKLKAEAK
jgi:peptide-methionine (S)-S-oxide reductase